MMPKDTNYHGTIFGGTILSLIDQASGVVAADHAQCGVVTVKMNEVVFRSPVFVGDLVSVYAQIVKVGRASMTVKAEVFTSRHDKPDEHVTSAELIFVAIDKDRRPVAVPPLPSPQKEPD